MIHPARTRISRSNPRHGAVELLQADAYEKKSAGFSIWLPGACEVALQRSEPDYEIDLHWQFCPPYFLRFDSARALSRSVMLGMRGLRVRTLCPEDLLLHLCLHGARDCWGIRPACDIAGLIRTTDLDWADLRDAAQRAGAERVLAMGLTLASDVFHAPLPSDIVLWCRREAAAAKCGREIVHRWGVQTTSYSELKLHLQMIGSVSGRLRYLWKRAVQPNHLDADVFVLPRHLSAAYYVIRRLRIACVALGLRD